ncbi:peptidoglycan-binding protein [Paenibacillus macerans]|uniref:peptidoglycan-binding domain-containing protein n=1 Tax=Paenibacillus macerans TaxID=44252 RepID=UPI003D2E9B5B
MELKVDPARINGLADEVRRLEQRIGDQVTVTLKRVSELASRTSSAYSEPGVRSAISEVERRMERIRQLSREIGDELRTKEKTLRWAANEYTRQEQESFLKAKRVKLPVTLNPFDAFPTTSGNKTSVFPLPFSAFSLFSRAAVYLPITVEPLTKELTLDPEHYSDEVLKLQERLQELGYELEASGYFDSATLAVVNRYKEKYGLDNAGDRQGIVDENVWRTLFGTLSGLLTVQMHGQAYSEPLKMAQLRLQELGFEVEANGYFDEATVRALEGFREVYEKDQNGLEGVIGPATWQALFNMPKVEPIEEAKNEPQYFIMADDPRSYSLDDVLNRDDPEVQERLKQTCWADLTKEEQDRIYNELKELEKKEENEMRQKQSGIGNPLLANLIVGGSNAVVNTINTASAGLPELLAEWIMGPEPEGYVNPLDDPYGKGAGEAAGNVVGFFLPFKYLKAVKTPAALSKLSPTLVRSMTAGAIFGTATEASDAVTDFKNDGDQDLTGRAQNIALDTALAGAGDVTFTYAFKLISSALKSTAGQKLTEWLKRSEVDEVPATQGKLETPAPNNVAEGTVKAGPIKEVEIVDHTGKPIGELDEIDLKNGIFYEDKAAKGLNVINPKTGLPAQTPQQFTDKQILDKTRKRINNIAKATATRATKNGTSNIPSLDQIKGIRKFIFRLDGDTPELRQAVENSLEQLRKEFPDYTFDALFGGKK